MGINVTNNLNNNKLVSVSRQVVPNVSVVTPVYTSVGWTAGDFIYQSISGIGPAPGGTVSIGGPITTLQATNVTVTNGGLFSATQSLISVAATGAVYTGPSTTVDAVFVTNTPSATTNAGSNYCATLLNGNIVVAYYDASSPGPTQGYYYAIYNSSGGTVLAPTYIASQGAGTLSMVGVVAKANGNFRIMYYTDISSGLIVSNEYTPAGTFINTISRGVSGNQPSSSSTCVRTIELTNGNVVIMYWNPSIEPYAVAFNAANTTSLLGVSFGGSTSTPNQSFALYTFPATSTGLSNGWGCTWWSANNGTSYYRTYNQSMANLVGTTGTPNTLYDSFDIIRLQNGTYMGCYGTSGASLQLTAYTLNTSNGALSTSGTTVNFSYNQNRAVKIIPMAGSGFAVTYINPSQQVVYRRSTGLTPDVSAMSSEIFVDNVSNPSAFVSACGTNAFLYFVYWVASSAVITFRGVATAALVNGTTYTATALSPPNYTFYGIAETTVSAGGTGNVIISGNAVANNSMPNVSGTTNFDFTQNPSFGNKGFVTGRNFTLKGFE